LRSSRLLWNSENPANTNAKKAQKLNCVNNSGYCSLNEKRFVRKILRLSRFISSLFSVHG